MAFLGLLVISALPGVEIDPPLLGRDRYMSRGRIHTQVADLLDRGVKEPDGQFTYGMQFIGQ